MKEYQKTIYLFIIKHSNEITNVFSANRDDLLLDSCYCEGYYYDAINNGEKYEILRTSHNEFYCRKGSVFAFDNLEDCEYKHDEIVTIRENEKNGYVEEIVFDTDFLNKETK